VRVRIPGSVPATLFWQARPVVDRTSSPVVDPASARGRHAVGPARAINAGLALSCLPRIDLHRIANGLDADMVVRVDGVLEEAVIRLCTGHDMDVFWDFGTGMNPKFGDSGTGITPDLGILARV